jgi:osmotically-inducible protein OsmY
MTIRRALLTTAIVGMFASSTSDLLASAEEQGAKTTTTESIKTEELSTQSEQHKSYSSPAERANDALIVTEVKAALAKDGVADGYVITVGADHGTVTLSGVLGSPQDIKHAISLARSVENVRGVQSRLTWEKSTTGN